MTEKTIGRHLVEVTNLMHREVIKNDSIKHKAPSQNDNLSHTASCIIAYLYNKKYVDVYQKDIEREFQLRRSTVSKILSLMEDKGHIKRIPVKTDKRLKKIILTDKTEAIAEQITISRRQLDEKMIKGLSENELELLIDILEKIKKNLSQED